MNTGVVVVFVLLFSLLTWPSIFAAVVALQASKALNAPSEDTVRGSPLHWACAAGKADSVAVLIQLGADVDARDHLGATPIMLAAMHHHTLLVCMLARLRANVHLQVCMDCTACFVVIGATNDCVACVRMSFCVCSGMCNSLIFCHLFDVLQISFFLLDFRLFECV